MRVRVYAIKLSSYLKTDLSFIFIGIPLLRGRPSYLGRCGAGAEADAGEYLAKYSFSRHSMNFPTFRGTMHLCLLL